MPPPLVAAVAAVLGKAASGVSSSWRLLRCFGAMRTLPLPLSRQFLPPLRAANTGARLRRLGSLLPPAYLPRSACSGKAQGRCVVRCAHPCAFPRRRSRRLVCSFFRARVPPQRPPQVSYILVYDFSVRRLRPRRCLLGRRRRSRRLRRRVVCLLGRLCDCRRWRTRSPCALAE